MEKVYLISTCIKINKRYSIFHFKGYFKGHRVKEVHLENMNFCIGSEYLIKMYTKGVEENILYGEALKTKKLD